MRDFSSCSCYWRFLRAIFFLFAVGLWPVARGHVQLAYPPPTLKLDFLDSFRTSGICGHSASGSDNSGYWKLPEPDEDSITPMATGSQVSVSWDLHYAHQGGFRLELYNSDLEMVSVWNNSDHWGCSHDGTQQSLDIQLPEEPCEGCILRLQRQALEWGDNYLFHSCSLVDILDSTENEKCNGCSGHGTCVKGKCECVSNAEEGFWYGQYCERQNECDENTDCGTHGVCIDTEALTAPAKQCYCEEGYFGKEVVRGTTAADLISTRDCSDESTLELGDPDDWEVEYPHKLETNEVMSVYYMVDDDAGEIEFAVRAKTTNWLSIGLRAGSIKESDTGKATEYEEETVSEDAPSPETAAEAEATPEEGGRRKLLSRMPNLEAEAVESYRQLLQKTEASTEEEDSSAETSAAEAEPVKTKDADSETEAEPIETKDDGSEPDPEKAPNGVGCIPGDPTTVDFDEGIHFINPVATGATLGDKNYGSEEKEEAETEAEAEAETSTASLTPGRRLSEMPKIEDELQDHPVHSMTRSILEDKAEAEGEVVSGPAAESEPSSSTQDKEAERVYFAVGTACENLVVDNPGAHAMINQDMIVAYAKGDAFRIQDTFTPSRARPSPDVFFGGSDDIIDAVGKETEDGYTLVKFRRKLETADQAGDYCILPDINYFVIYAIGQGPQPSHSPASSLETGRASNLNFYGEDELKYHGGGIGTTFSGRGAFGLVNFFEEVQEEGKCSPSTMEEFDCMSSELGGALELHWRKEDDGVMFGAKSAGSGWTAIAFPETPGVMVGADAVLGWEGDNGPEFDLYKLEGRASALITPGNDAFEVSDVTVETSGSSTLLMFKREYDESLTGNEKDLALLVAFNADTKEGFISHGTNRAGTLIDLTAVPSDDLAVIAPCPASDIEGFDCVSEQFDGKLNMNWKVQDDGIKMALVLEGTGYVSVAWPEDPGQMVGADAVIAWVDEDGPQIGVYKLESYRSTGIVETDAFEISDAEVIQEDGKTTLIFTRPFDEPGRRKLLFTPESGPQDLLFAFHDTEPSITHHSDRKSDAVDFQQQPPEPPVTRDTENSPAAVIIQQQPSESGGSDDPPEGCVPSDIEGFSCMTNAEELTLHWKISASEIAFAVRAPVAGYVAIGWPSTPGKMVGAKAAMGWSTNDGVSSAAIYSLNGRSTDAVVVDPEALSGISDLSVEEIGGSTTLRFTRAIGDGFESEGTQDLIYAYHTDDELVRHNKRGILNVNFASGDSTSEAPEDPKGFKKAHGWMMFAGWGVLLPIGIIVARTLKDQNPAWFYFHVTCQSVGILVALVAWIMAIVKFTPPDKFRHGDVGMATMILGLLQANAFFRPSHGARWREFWEYLHWSVGRVALVLAIYNIFTGLDKYAEDYNLASHNQVNFGMWILALSVVYLALEMRSHRIEKEKEKQEIEARIKTAELGSPSYNHQGGSAQQHQVQMHHRAGAAVV